MDCGGGANNNQGNFGGGDQEVIDLVTSDDESDEEQWTGYQGDNEEPCFTCGLIFSSVTQLEMHEKIHASTHLHSSKESYVNVDEDDDDDDIQELRPLEMESNDIEIPLSECPAHAPTFQCEHCRQLFWDEESLQEHCLNHHAAQSGHECATCVKQLEISEKLEAFKAHRDERGSGHSQKTGNLLKPNKQAKGVSLASGKRRGRKMKPRNEDGSGKVTPPAVTVKEVEAVLKIVRDPLSC